MPVPESIKIRGARQNNLRNLDVDIPVGKLTVITGLSGSGKSSLAFDTLYAEGQRRYVETFSPYARQFLDRMDKPAVDSIEGIPPAIAIGQANAVRSSRSTVGTMTEINDYLKLYFTHLARCYSPGTGREIRPESPEDVWREVAAQFADREVFITFEVLLGKRIRAAEAFEFLNKQGYLRILHEGRVLRTDAPSPDGPRFLTGVRVIQDRIRVEEKQRSRFVEAVEAAYRYGRNRCGIVSESTGAEGNVTLTRIFSNDWYSPEDDRVFRAPSPALFSFNNPLGACPACRGFGRVIEIDYDLALPDKGQSISGGVVKPFQSASGADCQRDLLAGCKRAKVPTQIPFRELTREQQDFVILGEDRTRTPDQLWRAKKWYGVRGYFKWLESKAYKMHVRVQLARYRSYLTCRECQGARFGPESLHYRVEGRTVADLCGMPVGELKRWMETVPLPPENHAVRLLQQEITSRLGYLVHVGLNYLTLHRATRTLSGGEVVRVNLTTCLGTNLVNTLFVLDEPTVGLHARDVGRLVEVLRMLRDRGNTVVVVEHEEQVMRAADHILDLGPHSGTHGGEIVFAGNFSALLRDTRSLTGQYLSGKRKVGEKTRGPSEKERGWLRVFGAREHNLKNVDVALPLGKMVCVTGVSGSGKSTLIHDVLYKNLLKMRGEPVDEPGVCDRIVGQEQIGSIVLVDQSPLAKTPRSTAAVYLGAYDAIRELFAKTDEAISAGLSAGYFSFNAGEGRCPRCTGNGFEKIEMQFLSDIYVRCPVCEGQRFQPFVLKVRYQGRNISEVLGMTIDEAMDFFGEFPRVTAPFGYLKKLGLGYLRLGQPLNTLSGGESQRLKLIGHLVGAAQNEEEEPGGQNPRKGRSVKETEKQTRPDTKNGSTWKPGLFVFDEPTTGLHFEDIRLLLNVFRELVSRGHTLLVIEHNLEVIRSSDWILDLGPESGENGGEIIYSGSGLEILKNDKSLTGKAISGTGYNLNDFDSVMKVEEKTSQYLDHQEDAIRVYGARHHNLKNISLSIPRNRMVVLTGVSGSGKSTLAFDLLFAEGQRRFMDSMSAYARQFVEQMEKPEVDLIEGIPPSVAIEQNMTRGGAKSTVATVTEVYHFMRLLWAKLGVQYDPDAQVPVERQTLDEVLAQVRSEVQKDDLVIMAPMVKARKGFHTDVAEWAREKGFGMMRVDGKLIETKKFKKLSRYQEHSIEVVIGILHKKLKGNNDKDVIEYVNTALKFGKGTFYGLNNSSKLRIFSTERFCPETGRAFEELDPRVFSFNSPHGWCPTCKGYGYKFSSSDPDNEGSSQEIMDELKNEGQALEVGEEGEEDTVCSDCQGMRLNRISLAVRVQNRSIGEMARASVDEAHQFFRKLKFKGSQAVIARDLIPEILSRLEFMRRVGLDYLTLGRAATTLSGGESQRIRLAAQLGSNLRGVLYVLDEPTIGLHPRDNDRLLNTLEQLRDRGNSLVIVEHDDETMRRADHLIDMGPGAGTHGGQIIAQGHWKDLARKGGSMTADFLHEPMKHPLRGAYREISDKTQWITLENVTKNNIFNLKVKIPIGKLTVITGVSGSGKSTLIREVLIPTIKLNLNEKSGKNQVDNKVKVLGIDQIDSIYEVDQSPIGKTPRSTPATYVGFMDTIRTLFAQTPMARMRGYTASRFSYNNKIGRCEVCEGAGAIKMQMSFLPTAFVHCEVCHGQRFNHETLEVVWNGKNISQVLEMTVEEAAEFFDRVTPLAMPLRLLMQTGLGYLKLGQSSPTLSGGEAQRLKLVTELSRRNLESTRRKAHFKGNIYCLEEPTIGLHISDVKKLLEVIHSLVDAGHTVIVIEHHLDLIAEADYVIDIGPEGGSGGGKVIFEGSVDDLRKNIKSHTAKYLRKM
ncbi:MAG: excinuclease ABC subunit UvrA [Verrucomicrobiae bacterium]|nr:excinuclease ABC subunit UvrA [Verrucomicrobiae bacterium]